MVQSISISWGEILVACICSFSNTFARIGVVIYSACSRRGDRTCRHGRLGGKTYGRRARKQTTQPSCENGTLNPCHTCFAVHPCSRGDPISSVHISSITPTFSISSGSLDDFLTAHITQTRIN